MSGPWTDNADVQCCQLYKAKSVESNYKCKHCVVFVSLPAVSESRLFTC
jgi:hypothetical protein